jgi:ATP-dependent Lhr-like helicase
MSAEGLALFRDGGFKSGLYGFNACDPASPSGLPANGLPDGLPSRLPVNRMVISERGAVCVSRRSWRELDLALEPDAPGLEAALDLLVEARRRTVDPERRVAVATINGESAASSPYAPALSRLGFEADRGVLTLW